MNKKTFKFLIIFVLTILLLLINNSVCNASADVDLSWEAISGQAKDFIDNGKDGADYINSANMRSLVGRTRDDFNNYWWCYCTSWLSSYRNTVYDGYT